MNIQQDTLDMVEFRAGGLRFAIETPAVLGMLAQAPDAISFAKVMGVEAQPGPTRVLALRQGQKVCPVVVEEPVSTRSIPIQSVSPVPPLMMARLNKACIRALLWDDSGLVILLSGDLDLDRIG